MMLDKNREVKTSEDRGKKREREREREGRQDLANKVTRALTMHHFPE